MAEADRVVPLAERLKSRREELGISQSQAARELDVARTAYRLWEMEAAKPAPDRWRLIAAWLGISVTTMMLAEDLMSEEEAVAGEVIAADFGRSGRDWDTVASSKEGDFFAQARSLIAEGTGQGDITAEQAAALTSVLQRVEEERRTVVSEPWAPAELRRTLPANTLSARMSRDAVAFVAEGIPQPQFDIALLLVSELVTNSIRHGPRDPNATVEIVVSVERERLRVEVVDGSPSPARRKPPTDEGGYGLALVAAMSSRWGAALDDGSNTTWFELDLAPPGTSP